MRFDSHQHFWRFDPVEYGWINSDMGVLRRDFLPEDLLPLLRGCAFDGCVAVQARQTLAETDWLLTLAERHDFVRGVVGWVDLRATDVGAQLERFAARPRLRGIRHIVQDEPDDGFLLLPAVQRGIGLLREHGLTYDLLIFPRHLPIAVQLVERFPEQPFVLDHLAKPNIAERLLEPWREGIERLARAPNVCCKLSGLVTETTWGRWKPADFHPYLEVALEAFGPQRLMVGSDWPVCTLSGSYGAAIEVVQDWIGGLSEAEQRAILGGTCARFYGL